MSVELVPYRRGVIRTAPGRPVSSHWMGDVLAAHHIKVHSEISALTRMSRASAVAKLNSAPRRHFYFENFDISVTSETPSTNSRLYTDGYIYLEARPKSVARRKRKGRQPAGTALRERRRAETSAMTALRALEYGYDGPNDSRAAPGVGVLKAARQAMELNSL